MWSREDRAGVDLLSLDGRVLATVPDVTIFNPTLPPGPLILKERGREEIYWRLVPEQDQLLQISEARALRMQQIERPVRLPIPEGSHGRWAWSRPAPDRSAILAQLLQNGFGSESSECSKPVAMIRTAPGEEPRSVLGQPLGDVDSSYALGWTPKGFPVIAVGGPCGGPGEWTNGVYIVSPGEAYLFRHMPEGSYYFRMWE